MTDQPTHDGTLLATVRKNTREEVRLTRKVFEGHDLLDARVWALSLVPGLDATPTKKGLCLRPETWRELCGAVLAEVGDGE
jgi:hypothetical protein